VLINEATNIKFMVEFKSILFVLKIIKNNPFKLVIIFINLKKKKEAAFLSFL